MALHLLFLHQSLLSVPHASSEGVGDSRNSDCMFSLANESVPKN